MCLPRARFAVRRLMVAMAIVAVATVWWAEKSKGRIAPFMYKAVMHSVEPDPTGYHARMVAKYEWAARYPWLPVWPDPPEPE